LFADPAPSRAAAAGNKHDGQYIFRFDTIRQRGLLDPGPAPARGDPVRGEPEDRALRGLKVDASVLPPKFLAGADLDSPATTVELLRRNAVVGVVAKVEDRRITAIGITCALCHSTVDNSVTHGIGQRLDGYPNLDLDPGAIIALSPALSPAQKTVYNSWGAAALRPALQHRRPQHPARDPAGLRPRGRAVRDRHRRRADLLLECLRGVTQMGGHGSFSDPRLGINIVQTPDLVTPKLPALLQYQLGLPAPAAPAGSFNVAAAARGQALFNGAARCGGCHVAPTYSDVQDGPDANTPLLHDAAETGMDPAYAARTATKKYRTTPLRALWQHAPYSTMAARRPSRGGRPLRTHFALGLTAVQKADLVDFLKSL
jgi:cytochrome c553